MSALPPKADITKRDGHVRFVPKADISLTNGGVLTRPLSPVQSRSQQVPVVFAVTLALDSFRVNPTQE